MSFIKTVSFGKHLSAVVAIGKLVISYALSRNREIKALYEFENEYVTQLLTVTTGLTLVSTSTDAGRTLSETC
jgi:hypothetical protein